MLRIDIVELNDKNKKGKYVLISEQGRRGAYYKYDSDVLLDAYINYHKDKLTKGIKRPLGYYKSLFRKYKLTQAEKYIEELKSRPNVEDSFKMGVFAATVPNIAGATNSDLMKAKMNMLKGLVHDQELIKVLAQEHNLKKVKKRFEYRIRFHDSTGAELASTSTFNKTIEKVRSELEWIVRKGDQIKFPDHYASNISKRIAFTKGYTKMQAKKGGIVTRTSVEMIFRKGK